MLELLWKITQATALLLSLGCMWALILFLVAMLIASTRRR